MVEDMLEHDDDKLVDYQLIKTAANRSPGEVLKRHSATFKVFSVYLKLTILRVNRFICMRSAVWYAFINK